MYFLNPRVAREGCRGVFSDAEYAAVAAFFARRRDIRPTPLYRLPALARHLGLRTLLVKDESQRMGLNAFKGAGAAYAIDRLMAGRPESDRPTLVCASAGNHGRAVAHAGAQRGLEVIVYMSAATAAGPRLAIEAEGARVALVDGTYDDAVRRATVDAAASGALIVSDTAWPGYEAVPHDIMAGYTHIFEEARVAWDETPDLAIVQAGVGSFAAAAAAWWSDRYGVERPCFVCCEPLSADPLLQSARTGRPTTSAQPAAGGAAPRPARRIAGARSKAAPAVAEGNRRQTIMSGLRCSEASSIAIPILLRAADVFVSIDDELTREAMRLLARPGDGDPPIVAGPSGAAGLGALLAIRDRERHRHARVLLVNTEGATDRALYDEVLAEDCQAGGYEAARPRAEPPRDE